MPQGQELRAPPQTRNFTEVLNVNSDFSDGLRVLYANVDSLLNKRAELLSTIEELNSDFILLTEVLPKNCTNLNLCEFSIEGYDLMIPSIKTGRGVAIYAKSTLSANIDESLMNSEYAESVWCRINLKGTDSLLVGVVYRSPNSTDVNNYLLNELIVKATRMKDTHILITGDFNLRDIDWSTSESRVGDITSTAFIECVNDCYLTQHVTENTRFREGNLPSLLDLLLTNEEGMIDNIEYMHPLGKSDHIMMNFVLNCYTEKQEQDSPRFLYHKGNYTCI